MYSKTKLREMKPLWLEFQTRIQQSIATGRKFNVPFCN